MIKHLVIPDCQVRSGIPTDYLAWLGQYIIHKKPDVIVQIGDFADMPSLCSYDVGKKSYEGRRYIQDINAVKAGMNRLMLPLAQYNEAAGRNHKPRYKPRLVLTLGNHEDRITRAIDSDAKLDGLISLDDLSYSPWGWEVVPFLKPIAIDGIHYCHYFPSGAMGRPCTTSRSILNKYHQSCFAGHQQGREIAYSKRADGKTITAIIAGSYYEHDEVYLNPVTNLHWRGVYMLHEVEDGQFDEMAVSLSYLKRKYGCK